MTVKAFPSKCCWEDRLLTLSVHTPPCAWSWGCLMKQQILIFHTPGACHAPIKGLTGLYPWLPWTTFLMSILISVLPLPDRESGDLQSTPGFHYCITIT